MKIVKCTKKAKKLLKESIIKWEEAHTKFVLNEEIPKHGFGDCPLCEEYCIKLNAYSYDCFGNTCPFVIDDNRCTNLLSEYDRSWARLRTVKAHLSMITYMKDLYKRCEAQK